VVIQAKLSLPTNSRLDPVHPFTASPAPSPDMT